MFVKRKLIVNVCDRSSLSNAIRQPIAKLIIIEQDVNPSSQIDMMQLKTRFIIFSSPLRIFVIL